MSITKNGVSRDAAVAMTMEAAPSDMELRPYSPGPSREDRAVVLVKLVPPDSQIGRIILPDTAQKYSGEAVVIDTGKGAWDKETDSYKTLVNLSVGDRIVVGRYVGTEVLIQREIPTAVGDSENVVYTRRSEKFTAMCVRDIMAKYERL